MYEPIYSLPMGLTGDFKLPTLLTVNYSKFVLEFKGHILLRAFYYIVTTLRANFATLTITKHKYSREP